VAVFEQFSSIRTGNVLISFIGNCLYRNGSGMIKWMCDPFSAPPCLFLKLRCAMLLLKAPFVVGGVYCVD
jgi:hypothetical protein